MLECNQIVIISIIVAIIIFSFKDEITISITRQKGFYVFMVFIALYFIFNNISDGVILLVFVFLLFIIMKPDMLAIIKNKYSF